MLNERKDTEEKVGKSGIPDADVDYTFLLKCMCVSLCVCVYEEKKVCVCWSPCQVQACLTWLQIVSCSWGGVVQAEHLVLDWLLCVCVRLHVCICIIHVGELEGKRHSGRMRKRGNER